MLECKSSIENELDIIAARRCAKEVAKELGFSTVDQVRIATAISELARNVVLYAKEGSIIVRALCEGERKGLEISVADNGPGIPNVELAMTDGYSTVSYTHLDVYKRQALISPASTSTHCPRSFTKGDLSRAKASSSSAVSTSSPSATCQSKETTSSKPKPPPAEKGEETARPVTDSRALLPWLVHQAVSYTHLDVYKRQVDEPRQ